MRLIHLACLAPLALAACATSPTGKPVLTTTAAASDLNQGASVLGLASALYAVSPHPIAAVQSDLATAQNALAGVAASLAGANATSGDLAANVTLANAGLNAAVAGLATVDPAMAAKVTGYRDALLAALRLYNLDAPSAGLPVVQVPMA